MRVKLGTVILDAAGTTSALPSLAAETDVLLLFDDNNLGDAPSETVHWTSTTTGASLAFWVYIEGADANAMSIALCDAVQNGSASCIVESVAGTTIATFSGYDTVVGDTEVHVLSTTRYLVRCALTYGSETVGTGGGSTDVDGLLEPLRSQYQRTTNGIAQCVIVGNFDTRAKAVAFANQVRSRASAIDVLPWLAGATSMRYVTEDFSDIVPASDATSERCRVAITLVQMQSDLVTLAAKIRLADYSVRYSPTAMQVDSGATGNVAVALSGVFTVHHEKEAVFNVGDTVEGELTTAEQAVALLVLWNAVKAASAYAAGIWRVLDMHISPEGSDGRYEFDIQAMIGSVDPVLAYSSDVRIVSERRGTIIDDTAGNGWLFEPRNKFIVTLYHRLAVQSVGKAATYIAPPDVTERTGFIKVSEEVSLPTKETLTTPMISVDSADFAPVRVHSRQWNTVYRGVRSADAGVSLAGTIFKDTVTLK